MNFSTKAGRVTSKNGFTCIIRLIVIIKVLVVMCLLSAPIVQGQPIYLGTFTAKAYPDPSVLAFIEPFSVGLYTAIKAVNDAGGIHNRTLQLVECETTFLPSKYVECMAQWKRQYYPSMVSIVNIVQDNDLQTIANQLEVDNIMVMAPLVNHVGRPPASPFTDKFAFLDSDPTLTLIALIKKAVNELHFTRLAFWYTPNLNIGAHLLDVTRGLSEDLGFTLAVLQINATGGGVDPTRRWRDAAYFDWLALRPQCILSFAVPNNMNIDILVDILNRSHHGSDNVDPNLVILAADTSSLVVFAAAYYALALYHIPIRLSGRVFIALSSPLMSDYRYEASVHARQDATTYFGGTAFLANGSMYAGKVLQTWTAVMALTYVLKRMDPLNLTKDAFIDNVFASSTIVVDDLFFGVFSRPCTGMRAKLGFGCECNAGYRTTEVYSMNAFLGLDPEPLSQTISSFSECGTATIAVPFALVYLQPCTTATASLASYLRAGLTALEAQIPSSKQASYEFVTGPNTSAALYSVNAMRQTRFLSLAVGTVFDDSASFSLPQFGGIPIIDPLLVPAIPSLYPFQQNFLYVTSTLNQEIHALCNHFTASQKVSGFAAIVVGAKAEHISSLIEQSSNTFGVELVFKRTHVDQRSAQLSVVSDLLDASVFENLPIFLCGVIDSSVASAVAEFLRHHPKVTVLVPFAEFSALYESWTIFLSGIETQLYFASSLRNWNAINLQSNLDSALMRKYFSAFNSSTSRHPLNLRGFFISAAVQKIVAQITSALTPATLLQTWYDVSAIAVSSTDFIGPYSKAACTGSSDSTSVQCESNIGAREIFVMSAADVVVNATNLDRYQSTTYFSSAFIQYVPLKQGGGQWSLSTETLIAICVGVIAFLVLVSSAYKLRRSARFKQLVTSGLWIVSIRVVTRFAVIILHIVSAISVVGASNSTTFSGFYLFLTCVAVAICISEIVILVAYFVDLVDADDDLAEDAMLLWDIRIAKVAMISLGAEEMPIIVMSFVALLRLQTSIAVLLSFAVSCFFAGTKVRFLKEVFGVLIRKLKASASSARRFRTLRDVAMFVRIVIRTTGWSTLGRRTLTHSATFKEIVMYQDDFAQSRPERYRIVRNRAKRVAIELKRHDVDAGEYFGIIHPYLAGDFDAGYKEAAVSASLCRRQSNRAPPVLDIDRSGPFEPSSQHRSASGTVTPALVAAYSPADY